MSLPHTLYRKMTMLIPTLPEVPEYAKSQVPGFMDLNLDVLSHNDEIITVALSHYYEQNGDLIPDPDMVISGRDPAAAHPQAHRAGAVEGRVGERSQNQLDG